MARSNDPLQARASLEPERLTAYAPTTSMSGMTSSAESLSNATEYSVSEISTSLKRTVEETFGNIRVRGEISGYRGPHSSGHAYFALKDDRARLEAVIWRGIFGKLRFKPEEGLEVVASGKLTTYPGSSKYQIVIDALEPAGAGALMMLLEERKRKLASEGLFDEARKQLLPFMPLVIGVVTSPTGSVIRDIVHRITARFPIRVIIWPVRVQGDTTEVEVSRAIDGFNNLDTAGTVPKPDILIVARGGGSLEDLWGFNSEAVVRAIAESKIPVISAVGHETDWTLSDLAADLRAPTPTAAAEMAVPVKQELEARNADLRARLSTAVRRQLEAYRRAVVAAARLLPTPDGILAIPRRRFDEIALRQGRALQASVTTRRARFSGIRVSAAPILRKITDLGSANERLTFQMRSSIERYFKDRRTRLGQAERLLGSLSYKGVLGRGFAVVRNAEGTALSRAKGIGPGNALEIEFADGRISAITEGGPGEPRAPGKRPSGRKSNPTEQGDLF